MSGSLLAGLLGDLADEGRELDDLVTALPAAEWATPTPAAGWTIAHQIAHLAWTDEVALRAATDPAGFRTDRDAAGPDAAGDVDRAAEAGATVPAPDLLHRWRTGRAALAAALAALAPHTALPWFGPDMSAASMATARLMETWAHGVDVRDAAGRVTPTTARLRAVAHLGVRTRDFAFRQHSVPPPATEFRVELTGPEGHVWTWGPEAAPQRVTGPAIDFCLRVTQRRHRDDLALRAEGPDADRWLDLAQAFAGPPGPGRPARTGARS
ncbi:TIGR03084 family metal-binding protein [Geodermatophilus normandii]|uniref:TIGR03084 family metal-binding protein n=1 Tax=Geodermatophilus normandii TaxID=1137989 RepID=UPI0031F31AB0